MKPVLRQLFSSSSQVSFGRVGAAVALLFVCVWVTYLVLKTHSLPDLAGPAVFIASLYGLSKAGDVIYRINNGAAKPNSAAPQLPEVHQG